MAEKAWPGIDFYYHWHLEILPILTKVAGFELGTGFYINPMPPESAAEYLRKVNNPGPKIQVFLNIAHGNWKQLFSQEKSLRKVLSLSFDPCC